jgi:flagellar biosynthesis/type III secretory pathway M-ring protein FliF/YscJ
MEILAAILLVVVLAWIGDRQLLKRQYNKNWKSVQFFENRRRAAENALEECQKLCESLQAQLEFEKSGRTSRDILYGREYE